MQTKTYLLAGGDVEPSARASRIGGSPLLAAGTEWPRCGGCGEPLGFVAQVDLAVLDDANLADSWAALFSCDRFGGAECSSAPDGKGTVALIVPKAMAFVAVAPPASSKAKKRICAFPPETILLASKQTEEELPLGSDDGESGQMVAGSVGEVTEWMQDPVESSTCPSCGDELRVAFQLDDVWGMTTATYTLICSPCRHALLAVQAY